MSELDPDTGIVRAVSEAQIIEDFGKYEGIRIERLDDRTVKASFEETFGEGSATGNSVLNVLLHAVRRQKNQRYWDGYKEAEEKAKQETINRLELLENQIDELTRSVNQLQAVETALQLLAGNIINLRTELLVIKAEIMKEEPEQ